MDIVKMFESWRSKGTEQQKQTPDVGPTEDYLNRLAIVESGGNPKAKAKTSSAAGLFQFTEGTWKEYVKKANKDYSLDDRFDREKATEIMKYKVEEHKSFIKEFLGKEPTNTDLYMTHFLGRTGGKSFLTASPLATVDKVMSKEQMEANRSIAFDKQGKPRRVIDVYKLFEDKLAKGSK